MELFKFLGWIESDEPRSRKFELFVSGFRGVGETEDSCSVHSRDEGVGGSRALPTSLIEVPAIWGRSRLIIAEKLINYAMLHFGKHGLDTKIRNFEISQNSSFQKSKTHR